MVDSFSISGGGQLVFGPGRLAELKSFTDTGSAVLICGNSFLKSSRSDSLRAEAAFTFAVSGEPDPDLIDSITEKIKGEARSVIAVGGGSALDTGKAVAAMCCSGGSVEEYLEGVGTKKPEGKTLPLIAVPTTAGTGSEATKNAVIARKGEKGYKKSLRHENYIPSVALIDPELYITCPAPVMASCGMDAFSQLLESYISTKSNIYTDTLAWRGLTLFLDSFMDLFECDEIDIGKMGHIAFAAYLSGITLANAGLGTVHGIAGPLGGFFEIPHGTACGTLMPETMRRTAERLTASGERAGFDTLEKMDRLGRYAGGSDRNRLLEILDYWQDKLDIPRLSSFGIHEDDMGRIVSASGNKNNPYLFSDDELTDLIKARL
ncbi:iron-containing alcohol dehydrogenase [Spirochaeta isovalerica]|uniref:Alcohol dehydrogenase class IV n=1 Tax=Spirochaeta isovalerica TaxID=150 RepID=A0A841RIG1_9SPIO|nr:iron-containing alcohol dehydrogenase [Spirochaeta isovalerica]MBB6482092.1 alcohol dehydrogenase class IV [Spirochaeta isovalerica]